MTKKILILIFLLVASPVFALTSNTHSTDLEADSSQYWSITDAAQTGLDITDSITISLRIKGESFNVAQLTTFLSKYVATQQSYFFDYDNNGSLCFLNSGNGTTNSQQCVSWTPSTGTWYMVSVTYNPVSEEKKFYINDSQQGVTQAGGSAGMFNSTSPVYIGNFVGALFSDGLHDDMRIWSRELSGTEISNLYNNPCTFDNGANLQAWWLWDNDAGVDQTANNNDLTNNGTATFSTTAAYACAAAGGAEVNNSQVIMVGI